MAVGGACTTKQGLADWIPASGFLNTNMDIALYDAFKQQLSSLGFIEGRNLIVDQRAAEGAFERLPGLANELVALHPDALVALGAPAAAAAQRATSTIPIVLTAVSDPVGAGFVKSLAHPGGKHRREYCPPTC